MKMLYIKQPLSIDICVWKWYNIHIKAKRR